MINLIITLAGLILVLGGLYVMSLGFATPPSMVMFIGGLIAFVLGLIIIIIFAGNLSLGSKNKSEKPAKKEQKPSKKPIKKAVKSVGDVKKPVKSDAEVRKPVKPVAPVKSDAEVRKPVKPVAPVKSDAEVKKPVKSDAEVRKSVKPVAPVKTARPKLAEKESVGEIKPKRTRRIFKSKEPNKATNQKQKTEKQSESAVAKGPTNLFSKLKEKSKSPSSKDTAVAATAATATAAGAVVASGTKKPKRPNPKRKIPNPKKRSATPMPTGTKSKDTGDNSYVAKRLNMLKQEYVEGIGDVDKFIDEKIGSINETNVASDNLKPKTSNSGGSNLIWSFESFDVQDSLKDTLIKSKSRLVMMYPWIRNIDVGILKKFMDTDSRLIIQEAGLDDDASVELIKLLMDNDVEIRTMPHIHTVAAVSDEDEGLIISTDPIYDSFEVGVKYTDPESVKQINNLFEEAWKLSNPIEL